MKVITNFSLPTDAGESALALGRFDGLHRAHQAVIQRAVQDRAAGLVPSVITFVPEPGKGAALLETEEQRLAELERMGVERVFAASLEQVRDMTPQAFVEQLLKRVCRARRVYCGFNFRFGKERAGDAQTLVRLCAAQGMEAFVLPEMQEGGRTISSTRIRILLQDGEVERANALLGCPFSFRLPVVHGRKLGRTIGIPTMNQRLPEGFVQPRFGVYVSLVELDGARYYGVTNVGVKPTVGSDGVVSETWIPGFSGNLYDRTVTVSLLHFLRPERKFSGLDALREQIGQDRAQTEHWLRGQACAPLQNLPA